MPPKAAHSKLSTSATASAAPAKASFFAVSAVGASNLTRMKHSFVPEAASNGCTDTAPA